jgi:cytochrome P450
MNSEGVEYNPFSYEIHEDPYPTYKLLRERAPAYYNEEHGFWALSRFEDIWNAFADWQTFSSANGVSLEDTVAFSPDMIITMDPPRQTKIRGLVARALTPRRVAQLEPTIRAIVTRHIDRFIDEGAADVITDLGQLLPMEVIAAFIGVPDEDQAQIRVWTEEMLHREPDSSEVPEVGVKAFRSLDDYFRRDLGRRRSNIGDDLVSGLLTAEVDGERLSDDEIVGFLFLLALAGGETTTKLIGNMTYNLCRHPDQKVKLLADGSLVAKAVEEALRFDTSTQQMTRTLTRDFEIHGRKMQAGKKVALVIASGNRDDREYEDPDEFDITRKISRILSFGHGPHLCVGASLARLETRVTFEELHRRLPGYEVDLDACVRVHNTNVRGFSSIPIRW